MSVAFLELPLGDSDNDHYDMMNIPTKAHLAFLGALIFLLVSQQVSAADYFVSSSGNDKDLGTRERPWLTLAKANQTALPGDTVTFLDGKYAGVIEPSRSGKKDAPITYRAENHLGTILTGGQSSDKQQVCVRFNQREYIVIEGFYLQPDRGGWMRLNSANHCTIRHCRMENATRSYSPIHCAGCHYNRYEDLQCWRSNNIGKWGHVSGDMWNNFDCTHNLFLRIHISRAGHRPFGLWFDSPHNVVRQCIFDCRWGRNFEFFSTPRLLVEECVITNGLDGSGSADGRAKLFIIDSIFRRNVIYRNYYGPMVINAYKYRDSPTFGMMRSRVYHNTWYRNHEYGYMMVDKGRQPDPHMVTGNIFQNNIFARNDPGGDGLALFLVSNIADDNLFQFNDLFGDQPGCKTVRYDWAWPGVDSWGGLAMTATEVNEKRPAQFVGNMDADPLFLDEQADDYRLRERSPCIDTGQALATTRAAGSGRRMPVDDARWFYDGFGIPGEQGDLVFVGRKKRPARVVQANIESHVLTLDRDLSWRKGEGVSLPYLGRAPDLGAYEHGAEKESWYRAPKIPKKLRVLTMETATGPVVRTDFEPENLEQWHYYWNFSRQKNTDSRMDNTTAASGKRSMRVFATEDGAIMSCDIRPRWWALDRFPVVKFAYRIPKGVPVGLWFHAFKSSTVGRGAVCVGGSPTRKSGPYRDLRRYELLDDDQWHEVTLDARTIREVFPRVKLLQMFRFYTAGNAKKGQKYWFDNFRILPVHTAGDRVKGSKGAGVRRAGSRAASVPKPRRPERKKADDEMVARYDAELIKRVIEEVEADREPKFFLRMARGPVKTVSAGEHGKLKVEVLRTGMELEVDWRRLTIRDRRSLALAVLREGNPSDHCLAAFYMIAAGDELEAKEHLDKGGDGAATVRSAFSE